jgi:hypothetical protein
VSTRYLAIAAAVALAGQAAAQDLPPLPRESPRWGSFQLQFSNYRPSIDREFSGGLRPYTSVFGGGRGLMSRVDVAKSLFTDAGTLEVGIGAGYTEKYGHGFVAAGPQAGQRAPEVTALRILPLRATLTYRFDYFAQLYRVPLVPFAGVSFDRYQWWVTNGSGSVAQASGHGGHGGTNGYSYFGGLAFLLDFVDSDVAREMDRDLGINNTYLFAQVTKSTIDDFGSSKSWNLSDDHATFSGGILFVF